MKPDAEVTRQRRSQREWTSFGMCVQQCGRLASRGIKCDECAIATNARSKAWAAARRSERVASGALARPRCDVGTLRACGACGALGHNRRTCKVAK